MAKRIITISREFGSGGRFIGKEVAKQLGIAYYDKNMINEIAEKSGLSPEYIQENAELSPRKEKNGSGCMCISADGTDHRDRKESLCGQSGYLSESSQYAETSGGCVSDQ